MPSKYTLLQRHFGYTTFRPGQESLIDHITAQRDVLGVMPTGAGKSICYQIPALLFGHLTLVISPLISLMKDQVNALTQTGISAAFLNSTLTLPQQQHVLENAARGQYRLLYVAPERLVSDDFLAFAEKHPIDMVTVDEAHCISQWGQDFRPSYLKIRTFIDALPYRPVISAFTATATPRVREDIVRILRLQNPFVLTTGFDRQNLYFEVQKPKQKYDALLAFLQKHADKSGIVYCSTRKTVEEVCDDLCADGYPATRYHAGLTDEERKQNQEDFLYDRKCIMVATNAFGMGIDKSNVAFVVHYNMPKNIESYYQEAGRAGRDGEPADCLLLYSGQDVYTALWLIEHSGQSEELTPAEAQQVQDMERERLKAMNLYCQTSDCLRAYILHYFEEEYTASNCGNCSNCRSEFALVDVTIEAQKILSCVKRMDERYGINMVIDVLRGSKAEKIRKFGFEKLSTYGIMKDHSAKELRELIDFLILEQFLTTTEGEYPLLHLTPKSGDILFHHQKVTMKQRAQQITGQRTAKNTMEIPHPELLSRLRNLRTQFAEMQHVPAYIIFSDASLRDMCVKLPQTLEEFLAVSGVGRTKCDKYGDDFIREITQYCTDHHVVRTVPVAASVERKSRASRGKMPFSITEEQKQQVILSDQPISISTLVAQLNDIAHDEAHRKLTYRDIADWLTEKGFIGITETEAGKTKRVPTELSGYIGCTLLHRVNQYGQPYDILVFDRNGQQFILDNLEDILLDADN